MEGFCRSCLIKFDEPTDLIPYSEKNRRMFVYTTGLQVKRNDTFTFQLCKECYQNMKVACNFKKTSRNSDKKFKNYLAAKEAGDNVDFCTFLKYNDESLKFRLPMYNGNSTPANRNKDDDNESTCTSIQNFITDILRADEIPDSEARIIKEVIEEEADILDDSLDSHWLQDDVSINTDFRMDFSFSPFSTPRSIIEDHCYTPKRLYDPFSYQKEPNEAIEGNAFQSVQLKEPIEDQNVKDKDKCVIDMNLENALKNDSGKAMLDELITTPPVIPNTAAISTPLINSILFGDDITHLDTEIIKQPKNVYMPPDLIKQQEIDVLYELFKASDDQSDKKEELIQDYDDIYMPDINGFVYIQDPIKSNGNDENYSINEEHHINETKLWEDEKNISMKSVKNNKVTKTVQLTSPIKNKYCLKEKYCKICEKHFKRQSALKIHFVRKHKQQIESKKRVYNYNTKICDYCGQTFTSLKRIINHIRIHMNPDQYWCDHCPLSFKTEAGLKAHLTTHGIADKMNNKTKKRSYVCKQCGAAQTSSSNHLLHVRRHSQIPSMSCAVCGKGFYRKGDLLQHFRCHTGEKPFECVFCGWKFAKRDALNRHIKSHRGEKPFHCTFCNKKFISEAVLKRHQSMNNPCIELQSKDLSESEDSNNLNDVTVYYTEGSNSDVVAKYNL